jgi:hypothetical protein
MSPRIEVIAIDESGSYRVRKLHTTAGAQYRVQVLSPGFVDGYHRTYHPETGFVHDVRTNPNSETSTGFLPTSSAVSEILWVREDLRACELSRFDVWSGPIPASAIVINLISGLPYQRFETWLVRPDFVADLASRIRDAATGAVQTREEPDGDLIQLHAVFVPK